MIFYIEHHAVAVLQSLIFLYVTNGRQMLSVYLPAVRPTSRDYLLYSICKQNGFNGLVDFAIISSTATVDISCDGVDFYHIRGLKELTKDNEYTSYTFSNNDLLRNIRRRLAWYSSQELDWMMHILTSSCAILVEDTEKTPAIQLLMLLSEIEDFKPVIMKLPQISSVMSNYDQFFKDLQRNCTRINRNIDAISHREWRDPNSYPPLSVESNANYILEGKTMKVLARQAHLQWIHGSLPDPDIRIDNDYLLQSDLHINRTTDSWARRFSTIDKAHLDLKVLRDMDPVLPNKDLHSVRVLCLTYSTSTNADLIRTLRSTWGKRCDGYICFSNVTDEELSTVKVQASLSDNWTENYQDMWRKSVAIWRTVAKNLLDDYDFFLAGGDDLYVVVENLRALLLSNRVQGMLSDCDGFCPFYLGRKMMQNHYLSFHSGGSGYILNQAAVAVLVRMLDDPTEPCLPHHRTSAEDVMVAFCLRQAGVLPMDVTDEQGRDYFHPLSPGASYDPSDRKWYHDMTVHVRTGGDCCSNRSVSFHDIKPSSYMRAVHHAIYRMID